MKIIFNDYEERAFKAKAEEYGYDIEKIKEVFTEVHDCNFDQDLDDIINLNEDVLKERK